MEVPEKERGSNMRRVGATPMMVGVGGNGEVMVIEGGVHRFRVNSSTVKIVW